MSAKKLKQEERRLEHDTVGDKKVKHTDSSTKEQRRAAGPIESSGLKTKLQWHR